MVTVIADDLSVCVDCALLIASGEVTDSDGNDITAVVASRQDLWWGTALDGGTFVLSGTDDEPFFSWSRCDGCGSALGGDRMKAAVLGE